MRERHQDFRLGNGQCVWHAFEQLRQEGWPTTAAVGEQDKLARRVADLISEPHEWVEGDPDQLDAVIELKE